MEEVGTSDVDGENKLGAGSDAWTLAKPEVWGHLFCGFKLLHGLRQRLQRSDGLPVPPILDFSSASNL